jgi:hypothetical protein
MLPLDSPRWSGFDTYMGDGADIPDAIALLRQAAGSPDEEGAWGGLRDFFYCQNTIKPEAAFATIPYAVPLVAKMTPQSRASAIIDIGLAEAASITSSPQGVVSPSVLKGDRGCVRYGR